MALQPDLETLRRELLRHYDRFRRDLPWRRTRDPYAIWVSEIMLQQTQVDTVKPRYHRFLERYPTVRSLAKATEAQVCEAWAGLGYYRRARLLHAAAVRVVEDFAGELPRDGDSLRTLPGIGRYTSGAIASIAFGREEPLVDGNVERVLCRIFAIDGDPKSTPVQKQLWSIAASLVRGERPGDLNQALMEHGATVCTPVNPTCLACPVREQCRAATLGDPTRFPSPRKQAARKPLPIAFAWIQTRAGIWLHQRSTEGLWAGLWEPPSASGARAKRRLQDILGVALDRPIATVTHTLSHRDVTARIYTPSNAPKMRRKATLKPYTDPLAAPLSALARKAVRAAAKAVAIRA